MHFKIFIIVIAFLGVFQLSCSHNINNNSTKAGNNLIGNPSSKSFSGTFFGITPCADCPGIEITIHFKEDSTFVENFNYMERNTSFADTGKWSISNKIITVSFPDHHSYFLVKSDSIVSILDADKREIEGPLSDKFILKKKNSDRTRIE
ncbi:MAG: copper resistance protein NlpE [Ginsengibacter sp.]